MIKDYDHNTCLAKPKFEVSNNILILCRPHPLLWCLLSYTCIIVFSTKNIVVAMGSVMRMVSDFLTKQGVCSFRIIHWKSGNQIYQVRNLQCCVYWFCDLYFISHTQFNTLRIDMYNLVKRRPDLLDIRDKCIVQPFGPQRFYIQYAVFPQDFPKFPQNSPEYLIKSSKSKWYQ